MNGKIVVWLSNIGMWSNIMSQNVDGEGFAVGVERYGGFGDVRGHQFFWTRTGESDWLEAVFAESGAVLKYPDNETGWIDFVTWSYVLGGVFGKL